MKLSRKIKIWYLFAQDNITIVLVFLSLIVFSFILDYCDSIKPSYKEYSKEAELVNVEYKYVYTHNGYTDAVPRINGVYYDLECLINSIKFKKRLFIKDYDHEVNEYIDEGEIDSLIVRYDPDNISKLMIFVRN